MENTLLLYCLKLFFTLSDKWFWLKNKTEIALSVLFNRHLNKSRMTVSFKYWNDCTDRLDLEAMWMVPDVSSEWLDAGETRDQNVHLSRDPDGQAYLTQTEMRVYS